MVNCASTFDIINSSIELNATAMIACVFIIGAGTNFPCHAYIIIGFRRVSKELA